MMKKIDNKGFVFVELVITVIVLSSVLVLLYSGFSRLITKEKNSIYEDDIVGIYKTMMISDVISENINMTNFNSYYESRYNCHDNSECLYLIPIRPTSMLFSDALTVIEDLQEFTGVVGNLYLKISDIKNIKNCYRETDEKSASDCTNGECKCKNLKLLSNSLPGIKEYLMSLNVPTDSTSNNGSSNISYAGHDAILISLMISTLDGENSEIYGDYKTCIRNNALDYALNAGMNINDIDTIMEEYYKRGFSYDMKCIQNVSYAWAYL